MRKRILILLGIILGLSCISLASYAAQALPMRAEPSGFRDDKGIGLSEPKALAELAASSAGGECGVDARWTLSGGTLTISGNGGMFDYDYDDEAPWSPLSDQIKTVKVQTGITRVGERSFYYCRTLTSFTLAPTVTSIGHMAFSNCDSLTEITIPEQITDIGDSAFEYCAALKTVHYNATRCIRSFDKDQLYSENVFRGCFALTAFRIGANVEVIPAGLCGDCTALTGIVIPDTVEEIGEAAFDGAKKLQTVTLPKGLTVISSSLFRGCADLTSIVLPKELTEISDYAFYGCRKLKSISFPENLKTIGPSSFSGCIRLENITIPDHVEILESNAFSGCTMLSSITIPASVRMIGRDAFSGCTSLKQVTIPENVTQMGEGIFSDCTSLEDVYFNARECEGPSSSYFSGAFPGCEQLKTVHIGGQVKKIPNGLFKNSILSSVSLPAGVESIGSYAFFGCGNLTEITIPESVNQIGSYAFNNCGNLKTVNYYARDCTVDRGGYGDTAFHNCGQLTGITIGPRVRSIPSYLIGSCNKLTEVRIPEGVEVIQSDAFQNCTSLERVYISETVKEIGYAFEWCENLNYIYGKNGTCAAEYAARDGYRFLDCGFHEQYYQKGNAAMLFGGSEARPGDGDDAIKKVIQIYTKEDIKFIKLTLRYDPKFVEFNSAKKKEFGVLSSERHVPAEDGYETVTVTAQVDSSGGSIPAGEIAQPFQVSFSVLPSSPVGCTSIEILESSCLQTAADRTIPFDGLLGDEANIVPRKADYVEISGPSTVSEAATYRAVFSPYYTTDQSVEWSIGNPELAAITPAGRLQPKREGVTFLFVKALDGSGVTNSLAITIENLHQPVRVEQITISGADQIDSPTVYQAEIQPGDATNQVVEWSVDDPETAWINQAGLLIPRKTGTVYLTAAAADGSGIFAQKAVEITQTPSAFDQLTSDAGVWKPAYVPGYYSYEIIVPSDTDQVTLRPEFAEGTLRYGSKEYQSGSSIPINIYYSKQEETLTFRRLGHSNSSYRLTFIKQDQLPEPESFSAGSVITENHMVGMDLYRMDRSYPNAVAFLAVYDEENRMLKSAGQSVGANDPVVSRIQLSTGGLDPKRYKLFLWDSANGMRPIIEQPVQGELY